MTAGRLNPFVTSTPVSGDAMALRLPFKRLVLGMAPLRVAFGALLYSCATGIMTISASQSVSCLVCLAQDFPSFAQCVQGPSQ